jgi:hypothetical protein
MERPMSSSNATGPTAEQRAIDDLQSLIAQLPKFRPLVKFFRSMGIDPKSGAAFLVAHLALGLKTLPKPKNKWTIADDLALKDEVSRLRAAEGLSERKAIEKIAASQRFPYMPRAGRRYPNSDPKEQQAAALRKHWTDYRKRQKLLEEEARKLGAAGIWGLAIGIPAGEILRAFRPFQVTSSNHYPTASANNGRVRESGD